MSIYHEVEDEQCKMETSKSRVNQNSMGRVHTNEESIDESNTIYVVFGLRWEFVGSELERMCEVV